ncbi:MAG: zinc ribbon domain-containing protein [Candidatus Hodarchaeota archaeon]
MLVIKKIIMVFVFLLLIFGYSKIAFSQDVKIDLDSLMTETQKMSDDPDAMTLVWWIPDEFWIATAEGDPTFTEEDLTDVLNTLQPYTLFAIVKGKIGAFGGVTYTSGSDIKKNILLVGTDGIHYQPISDENIEANAKNLIMMMKPIFANMLGGMGENCHFLLFPAKNIKGQNIANANDNGSISILLENEEFRWRLPLDSVLPPKVCPNCGEKCNRAWNYCPWCGTSLKIKKKPDELNTISL